MTRKLVNLPSRSGKPPLALLDAAAKALGQCVRVDAAKGIRDIAVAFQTYANEAKDTVLVKRATEIRFCAETKAGELLHRMEVEGKRAERQDNLKRGPRKVTETVRDKPTLDSLGINDMQSKRWRKLAVTKLAFPDIWNAHLDRLCRMAAAITEGDKAVIAEARAEQNAEKKRQRDKHERELAEKIYALPVARFGVIYADPPVKFVVGSEKWMSTTAAANHYAVTDTAKIAALDVDSIAAADAVLFLWATQPMLDQALSIMVAWGFKYVSHCIWLKTTGRGTGYWFINKHEILLVGTRGKPPAPAPGTQPLSVIEAPRGRHSAKPEIFAEIIERMFPTVPKIELYRRGPARPGWSAWGAEAITPKSESPDRETEASPNFNGGNTPRPLAGSDRV